MCIRIMRASEAPGEANRRNIPHLLMEYSAVILTCKFGHAPGCKTSRQCGIFAGARCNESRHERKNNCPDRQARCCALRSRRSIGTWSAQDPRGLLRCRKFLHAADQKPEPRICSCIDCIKKGATFRGSALFLWVSVILTRGGRNRLQHGMKRNEATSQLGCGLACVSFNPVTVRPAVREREPVLAQVLLLSWRL